MSFSPFPFFHLFYSPRGKSTGVRMSFPAPFFYLGSWLRHTRNGTDNIYCFFPNGTTKFLCCQWPQEASLDLRTGRHPSFIQCLAERRGPQVTEKCFLMPVTQNRVSLLDTDTECYFGPWKSHLDHLDSSFSI